MLPSSSSKTVKLRSYQTNLTLEQTVPVLLESMIYSQDDQVKLEAEAEDKNIVILSNKLH